VLHRTVNVLRCIKMHRSKPAENAPWRCLSAAKSRRIWTCPAWHGTCL